PPISTLLPYTTLFRSAPESKPDAPPGRNPEGFVNGNPRSQSITDMAYVDGKVIVAGLSNEEFASDLRYIPFPFKNAERGTGVQIDRKSTRLNSSHVSI